MPVAARFARAFSTIPTRQRALADAPTLARAADAHRILERREAFGKVVLEP